MSIRDGMITFHEMYERHSKDVYRYSYWLSGSAEGSYVFGGLAGIFSIAFFLVYRKITD